MATKSRPEKEKDDDDDEGHTGILSVVAVKGHNFKFRCHIKADCCDYIAEKNFIDCVRNESFILSNDDDDDEKKRENDDDDDERCQITPAIFVMMTSKIIREIIQIGSYRVHKKFDPEKGIIFVFAHKLLAGNCTLHLRKHDFQRNITDINDQNLKSLVIKLLNEIEELKDARNDKIERISRREFIDSKLWHTSPFDICYNEEEILDKNGAIQKWVIDAFDNDKQSLADKYDINIFQKSGLSVKDGGQCKAYQNPCSLTNDTTIFSSNPMISFFGKNSKIICFNPEKTNEMRIICKDNNYYLKGVVYVKLADVKGGLLQLRDYPYRSGQYSGYLKNGVDLESFNKLIFGAKQRVIGITKRLSTNLKSPYFMVNYYYPGTDGVQSGSFSYSVVYQVEIFNKVIYLNFITAFEGDGIKECKNRFNGYLDKHCYLQIPTVCSASLGGDCSNDKRGCLTLDIRLF